MISYFTSLSKTIADKQSYLKLIVILCGHEIKGSVKRYQPNIIYTFADKAFKKKGLKCKKTIQC